MNAPSAPQMARKRPVTTMDMWKLADRLERDIGRLADREPPERRDGLTRIVFMLLGTKICGEAAGPLLGAALEYRPKVDGGRPNDAPGDRQHL